MTFHVGQRVVCVDADGTENLTLDAIYTISQCWNDYGWHLGAIYRGAVVLLVEAMPNHGDIAIAGRRFRPIVERLTDISFAHEILRKASKQVDA